MLATVVDVGALLKVVLASLAAGIGGTAAFAVFILGTTRFVDLRRDGRTAAAGMFGVIAAAALAVVAAAIVLGFIVMVRK